MTGSAQELSEPRTDEDLMRRFRESLCESSFGELMKRHHAQAAFVAEARLGNAAHAQDAVQEAFLRVVRERARYDAARPFAPWFFTILRNVCTDFQRKEARYRGHLEALAGEAPPPASAAPAPGPACEALATLDADEREVLVLRLVHGLSFREVAARFGCSEEAAKKRGQRALRKVKERMAPETSSRTSS
jgi:DNA-directed RNA polymerase specialized sigma24 family protein